MSSLLATNRAGVIAGAVIGAFLLLLLLLLLIWLLVCCCHKRRYQKEVANEIRYCISVGNNYKHLYGIIHNQKKHLFETCVTILSPGRMPRPQRADPPVGPPASAQWWRTAPTKAWTTPLWGATCPVSVNLNVAPSTQAGVMGGQYAVLLLFSTTINMDTLCSHNPRAWKKERLAAVAPEVEQVVHWTQCQWFTCWNDLG